MKKLRIDLVESIKEENVDHNLPADNFGDIIKGAISDQLVLFQETLTRILKKKDDETKENIKTIEGNYMKTIKNLEETYQEEFNNFEAKIKKLENENKKLTSEIKTKKKQQKCKECEDLKTKLNDLKISQAAEDLRMKKHVFKRQEKVKRYKQLLMDKDQEIMEKEEQIAKYQEELYAFEEKLKQKDDKSEDPAPAEDGDETPEIEHDPIDELLSPVKPTENNRISSPISKTKNHSSLLTLVESAISSFATGEISQEKKGDSDSLGKKIEGFKSRGINVKRSKAAK